VSTVAGLPSYSRPAPREARAVRDPRDQDLLFTVPMARGLAFVALSAWGALHWMAMLQPSAPGRGWAAVAVGLAAAVGLLAAGRAHGRRRVLLAVAVLVPAAALAALAGGVPADLLRPERWSELSSGIGRGIADLPGIRVPYEGLDTWVRIDIPLGGSALVLLAAALAFWPRRDRLGHPLAALVVLIMLYVVPVVALEFTVEFVRGAVFTVLMVAFLRLEKLRMPDTGAAAWLALATIVLGLAVAPALNRDQPWFDYEDWALETSASKSDTFSWNHTYGTLNWPRDGRELLRVKAKRPAYWKAENLDTFDGVHWVRGQVYNQVPEVPPQPARVRAWSEQIRVTVRNLRSASFLTAGYAFKVNLPHVPATPTLDGLYMPGRTLRRGDTYTANIYFARPTQVQRRAAGVERSLNFESYRQVSVPVNTLPGVRALPVIFPPYHAPARELRAGPPVQSPKQIQRLVRDSPLARTYRLSRQLARGARTPDDYVQRVLDYLAQPEFTYNEAPPRASRTLDGFLFDTQTGYCQQYSGAMALLLRMAGIPARVVTGFSTGATDLKTGEYVVRDFDAHSWVEAYYPDWGWITFDPTPAQSPARSQPSDASNIPNGGLPASGVVPGDAAALRAHGVAAGFDRAPWWRTPLIVLAVLAAAASALAAVRRRRRGAPSPLFELERALRRARREPAPGTTLRALEVRFAATPAAAGYVRTLIDSRYREAAGRPTRAQRRGLRSELGRGSGVLGRMRAWWALPPR
jgi:transglutaminase-like putative cysteine protease